MKLNEDRYITFSEEVIITISSPLVAAHDAISKHLMCNWKLMSCRLNIPHDIVMKISQQIKLMPMSKVVAWLSGNGIVHINEVTLNRARLVLGSVTMSRFSSRCGTFISVCDWPPRSTHPGHPFVSRRSEYQLKRAVTPCGWGVKAGMIHVWVAGKTVWSPCYTSERFRDKGLLTKRYINLSVLRLPPFLQHSNTCAWCCLLTVNIGWPCIPGHHFVDVEQPACTCLGCILSDHLLSRAEDTPRQIELWWQLRQPSLYRHVGT